MQRPILVLFFAGVLACSSGGKTTHEVGDTCRINADCGGLLVCYSETAPGVCSVGCDTAAPICAAGSSCAPLNSSVGSALCLASCSSNAQCPSGYNCCAALGNVCAPAGSCSGKVPLNPTTNLVCVPPAIVNGGVAGPSVDPSICQKPLVTTTFPGAQVQLLGPAAVGTTLPFTVPSGTGTISILQQVVDAGAPDTVDIPNHGGTLPNGVVPFKLLGPDGGVFYDDDAQPPDDLSTLEVAFGSPQAASASMILPNTTQALSRQIDGYPAGQWSLVVNDIAFECAQNDPTTTGCTGGQSGQQYDIQIVTKPIAPNTGTIDVGLYLVTNDWRVDNALADPNGVWNRFVAALADIYARAGLCLGTVTFYDVPGWAKVKFGSGVDGSDNGPCSTLDQMFTLSQPGAALPLFFVDHIVGASSATGGVIVGIDGSIPGPTGAGGTVHSGALINVSDLSTAGCSGQADYVGCGADSVAYIAAHEGGHYLGLFHTSEQDGSLFDPLTDTPQCPRSCDVNLPRGILDGRECSDAPGSTTCGGSSNLMFWLISGQSKGGISPDQARIMRANPAVH